MERSDARKSREEREAKAHRDAVMEARAEDAARRIEAHFRVAMERTWGQAGLDPSQLTWPADQ